MFQTLSSKIMIKRIEEMGVTRVLHHLPPSPSNSPTSPPPCPPRKKNSILSRLSYHALPIHRLTVCMSPPTPHFAGTWSGNPSQSIVCQPAQETRLEEKQVQGRLLEQSAANISGATTVNMPKGIIHAVWTKHLCLFPYRPIAASMVHSKTLPLPRCV